MRSTRTRRRGTALAALGLALAAGVAGLGPSGAGASSHREAPLIAADPAVDNTDVYAFVSPDRPGYVTFVANWIPFEEPNGGPNFYPFATDAGYNINIDNNGDARPDVVYRWTFQNIDKRGGSTFLYNNGPVTSIDDENLLFRQTYTLQASFHGGPFETRVEQRPGRPVPRRPGLHAGLRDAARPGRHHAAGRLEDLRRPGRRPVLPRPARLRPAVRRQPERGRAGHAGRLQREHHRAAGAVQGRGAERATPSATRSSASGPPPSGPGFASPARRPHRPTTGSRCPAWATRWSTRSSSRPG